ncbi:MAG: phosphodiester glycosidase family protein [Cyanobacteria bacterium SIG28]|nr:phosphodiester glycosidase family protein [Cyanobacteria bacterium SIG28]
MDTILTHPSRFEKVATTATGIIITISILISQNLIILAKDLGVGNYTGLSPTLNYIQENNKKKELFFEEEILKKYSEGIITEVDKGVKHVRIIRYYNGKPVRINVVELSTDINTNLDIVPAIASEKLSAKKQISNIAKEKNAIVAINAGYFKPNTGVPLGTLMINKKLYTGPIYDRVAIGFFENGYDMARVKLEATINTNIGGFKIDNVNQPRMLSTHTIVYTRDWGETTPPTPKYGTQLVISRGKLIGVTEKQTTIPQDGFVIVGPVKNLEHLTKAKSFKLNLKTSPNWSDVNHIISGGPYLVKDNEIFVDMTAQKLTAIGGRNPRTAIGYTNDNHLIMLTADGREGASVGLTLIELANLMKEFGCINAMNLDGGGSTVMYVKGKIVNKPAVQGGIPLSHTLTVKHKNS